MKVALGNRGMTMEAGRQCAKDRKEWRALIQMYTEKKTRYKLTHGVESYFQLAST